MEYVFKDARAWLSNTPHYIAKGQVVDCKDIDPRTYAPVVKPNKLPQYVFDLASTEKFFWGIEGTNFLYTNKGNVYVATAWTKVSDLASADGLITVGVQFNNRYLLFYRDTSTIKILKIDISDADLTNREVKASYDENRAPTDRATHKTTSIVRSAIVFNSRLYIANGKKVLIMDSLDVVTEWLTNLEYEVVGLSKYGSRIRVYLENWDILYRDGIEGVNYEVIPLGKKIANFSRLSTRDMIWLTYSDTSNETDEITIMSGYQQNKVRDKKSWVYMPTQSWVSSVVAVEFNGIVYFVGRIKDWANDRACIYTYGKYFDDYPISVNVEHTLSSGQLLFTGIAWLHVYRDYLYISVEDTWWTNKVERINIIQAGSDITSSGKEPYLTYQVFTAWDAGVKKALRAIELLWGVGSTKQIDVYYRANKRMELDKCTRKELLEDQYADWTLLDSFTSADAAYVWRNERRDVALDRNDIQFRVVLKNGATYGQLKIFYEIIKE